MSTFEFTGAASWGGRPVARRVSEAAERQRVVVTGVIRWARTVALGPSLAYTCMLHDGTGGLTLVFVGRHSVHGMVRGARCTAEGTARSVGGRLELWNPAYLLEPSDTVEADMRDASADA